MIYDDNVFRSPDFVIDEFRANTNPLKFTYETYDDLIVSPRIQLSIGHRWIGSRDTEFRIGYTKWQYYQNGEKNNESWTFRLRQPTWGRDNLDLSYSYAPASLIRPLSDRPPFQPRSSTPLVWLPFKSTRNAFLVSYWHRFPKGILGRFDVGRTIRYYNRPFIEDDNWEWNGAAALSYGLSKAFRVAGEYTYSDVEARGTDTVGEKRETSDNGDASYKRDMFELSLDYSPRGALAFVSGVGLMGQYQAYYFTTNRSVLDDPLHVGRKDEVYVGELTVDTSPLYRSIALQLGYRYSQRVSTLPGHLDPSIEDEEKDYKDNRTWLGATYTF